MKDYERLGVWSKAHSLALRIHRIAKTFPKEELFGLTSQIRRSAMSIPSNIAEGCYRKSAAEFAYFLQVALGSAGELKYQLLYAFDLGYLTESDYQALKFATEEIMKMLYGLLRRLRAVP